MWRVEPGCETHDTSASEPTLRAGKPRSETGCSVVGQPLSAFGWHFQETVTADNRGRSNAMAVVAQPDSTRCRSKSNQGDVGHTTALCGAPMQQVFGPRIRGRADSPSTPGLNQLEGYAYGGGVHRRFRTPARAKVNKALKGPNVVWKAPN